MCSRHCLIRFTCTSRYDWLLCFVYSDSATPLAKRYPFQSVQALAHAADVDPMIPQRRRILGPLHSCHIVLLPLDKGSLSALQANHVSALYTCCNVAKQDGRGLSVWPDHAFVVCWVQLKSLPTYSTMTLSTSKSHLLARQYNRTRQGGMYSCL